MGREDKATWKANYFVRIIELLDAYPSCFIVGVDNVGSKQMQQIRQSMRGYAEILMGKNTMIRKAIRGHLQTKPDLEKLLPYIVGNVGFVFTNYELSKVRTMLLENRRGAPAKAGAIAPCDVKLPPQNTGMGPEKTSFFQALQIPTKISRGTIEILNEVHLIKTGEKVYEKGMVYTPDVLDLTPEIIREHLLQTVRNIAAISLEIGRPTIASVPHSIANAVKGLIAIAVEANIELKEAEKIKEYLADPSKFAASAPATSGAPAAEASAESAPAAAPKEEKEEESDEDMGFGLFD